MIWLDPGLDFRDVLRLEVVKSEEKSVVHLEDFLAAGVELFGVFEKRLENVDLVDVRHGDCHNLV